MVELLDKIKRKMQFKVPQNVQRQDTIVGPLTLVQLVILGLGGGLAYAIYVGLSKQYYIEIWLPPVAIISGITLAFAFLKIHSLPFHLFLTHFIEYSFLAKKRRWVQGSGNPFISELYKVEEKKKVETVEKKKKDERSIEKLSEILDTGGKSELNQEEKHEELEKIIKQNYKNKEHA